MNDTRTQLVTEPRELPPAPVSWEQFHDWLDGGTRAEWVDGEIILMSPNNVEHILLGDFLVALLREFVAIRGLGVVLGGTLLMHLPTRPSGRGPDILFVANANLSRLQSTYLEGPADLVVEILSPDSDARDRDDKLKEYEQAGIPEYWVIDPIRREPRFYRLDADGRYQLIPIGPDGIYRSRAIDGFWLRVDWLWQRPLPALAHLRDELGI